MMNVRELKDPYGLLDTCDCADDLKFSCGLCSLYLCCKCDEVYYRPEDAYCVGCADCMGMVYHG